MTPDVLLVGHIARDITDDGWRAGGSVLYAATQCQRLGLEVAAVTVCDDEIDPIALVSGVSWQVIRDKTSTTFENHYVDGRRQQRVLAQARQIGIDDIPEDWQGAPIVLLMPIFHDVAPGIISSFASSATLLGATVQGWLRELDITDVRPACVLPSASTWQGMDVLFVSEEDVLQPEKVEEWAAAVPTVVLTRGRQGTTIWSEGKRNDLPVILAEEVDPTGAGDVFASAFTVRMHETRDALAAGRFAAAAASLSVQGRGTEAIGDRAAIESLLRQRVAWR